MAQSADVTLITDPRFMGGTASAFVTDAAAFLDAGLKVSIVLFRSNNFFQPDDGDNPALTDLATDPRLVKEPGFSTALFFHNPQIFGPHQTQGTELRRLLPKYDMSFMIAHHPPFLGNGALCYDPLGVSRGLAKRVGTAPRWLPVSGLVRGQLQSFAPLIDLGQEDWVNSFDTTAWRGSDDKLQSKVLNIGRHGRAHPDKWPDDPMDLAASLPASDLTRVRILGADPAFFKERGVDISRWEILPFGAETPARFLAELDVFSYFHSATWREAFGRTIAEAMMCGARCILDPALRPTFGEHALYCHPREVEGVLDTIRQNPLDHVTAARAAGDWCRAQFSTTEIVPRYRRLLQAPSARWDRGQRDTGPVQTLRKWIGFQRRNRSFTA